MKIILLFLILASLSGTVIAQSTMIDLNSRRNVVTTSVPFVQINPNAQARGFGEIGVVASDYYYESGLTQNPALLSRNRQVAGFKMSYLPWLRSLVDDMNFYDFGIFGSIGKNNAIGYSYKYFDLGPITFTDQNGNEMGSYRPYEFYHSWRYARTFTENFSIGIGGKYIVSDLGKGTILSSGNEIQLGKSLAVDFGVDYRNKIKFSDYKSIRYDIGFSILNIGNKVKYVENDDRGDFIPTIMKAGILVSYELEFNEKYKLSFDFAYQTEKLLVPTLPVYQIDSIGLPINNSIGNLIIYAGYDPEVSVFKGMIQSFYDAPGGALEEWREINHMIGLECRFTIGGFYSIALRNGYFYEHELKGSREYFTFGFGLRYKFLYLDYAGIITNDGNRPYFDNGMIIQPTKTSPLDQTWNINLGMLIDFEQDIFNRKKKN